MATMNLGKVVGPAGPGLPAGGSTGQVAVKASATNYDVRWEDGYAHPATHPASMITESADKRFVSDVEKISWNNKVDKVAGKGLSTEDYTTAEKTKLAGIAEGANNYVHPESHPASIIMQDANNRFVTDEEKSTWSGKLDASHAGEQVDSSIGVHGLRWYDSKLQYDNGSAWAEIETGGGGGLLPQIIVTVDSGSTVTATCGDKTVTGTSNGTCVLDIPNYGTWSVTASLSGKITFPENVIIDTVKQHYVTLEYADPVLNSNSWADIHSVSDNGANYWSVGDRKAVTLSGTVGTQSISGTYYVFILGFNHNGAIEGNGIHFGGFKTALTGGTDICLVDSKYSASSTDGSKYFNMNHSENTNTGGWKGCDLRYDILGSVNSKGVQNAASTTATSPVSNTLMAALPSDLRAVMQPMTKYSDNTGGGNDTASYVTATVDYLPLLAEFEIFGTRTRANNAEKNYQLQYTYFVNGNSKVKYKHNDTAATADWRERSVSSGYTHAFCTAYTNGTAGYYGAYYSYGISPAFKV